MKKHLGLSRLYKIIGLSVIIWMGNILPVFADWPCWRGPYGSGVAIPCGRPIINDLSLKCSLYGEVKNRIFLQMHGIIFKSWWI